MSDEHIDSWPDLTAWFGARNLPEPPVPTALRLSVKAFGPSHWGIRYTDPMVMYLLRQDLVSDLLAAEQFAVSHAGHGANSYAITYCLAHRGLVLVDQVGWGGVYMDADATAAALARAFDDCRALLTELERRDLGDRRLVSVRSDLRRLNHCGWAADTVPDTTPDPTLGPVSDPAPTIALRLLRDAPSR